MGLGLLPVPDGELGLALALPVRDLQLQVLRAHGLLELHLGAARVILPLRALAGEQRDEFVLEEELLFPANTQVAVFVSMDIGEFFALDSLSLKIDNKEVANYLYTPREAEALLKGGVHRVYLGNLKVGEHQLVAFFEGKGPNQRDYKRGANIKFEKGVGAKYLELKITDRQRKAQPEFAIKDWE